MTFLDGRVAVITGAGRGIGASIARLLAANGARVVVNDLGVALDGSGADSAPAKQVVDEIIAAGGDAIVDHSDVTDADAAHSLIQTAVDTWGSIDVLVNAAGILRDRMIFNMSEQEWDDVIRVHLKGHFNTTKPAANFWREQRNPDAHYRLINFTSTSGLYGALGQPNYAAAKNGIIGLMWSTANAMAKYGVTANSIMPSGATRMIDSTPRGREVYETTGKWPSEQAVGTERDPDNVAPLVVFLSSDQAAAINGQVFHSFGFGYTLLAQPQASRRIEGNRRLTPEELAKQWSDTMGKEPKAPWGTAFGRTLNERPASEWKDVGQGIRAWKWGYGEP